MSPRENRGSRHCQPLAPAQTLLLGTMGGAEGGPAAVKGILKPSTLRAEPPSAAGDAGADARRDAKGKAPLEHSRDEEVRTHTFHRFHDRVADVFASLGPGLTRVGASASGSGAPAPPPAWMPANTSVVRRGRDVRDGSDEASDSDSDDGEPSSSRAPDADQDGARKRKRKGNEPSGEYPDDLDCLASDDDDDETRRGLALGRSVGRCAALDGEDEYDYYDAVAAGEKKEKSAAAGSGGAGTPRAARATYVPPAKRARGGGRTTTARRVAWDGDVREARREPRGNAVRAPARTSDVPSRRRGNSWVPDHVRNPHKYDCYALDEPLIIGGGSHPGDVGSIATPDLSRDPKTVTRGSANAVRENEGSRTSARGVGPPGGGDENDENEDDAKRVQMPTPTFSASSTAAAAAREAARRRRDERRVVVAANGAVPAVPAKAERNENLVSFDDADDDDEAEDGGGGGAAGARVAGFKRGNVKRARSLRKRGV